LEQHGADSCVQSKRANFTFFYSTKTLETPQRGEEEEFDPRILEPTPLHPDVERMHLKRRRAQVDDDRTDKVATRSPSSVALFFDDACCRVSLNNLRTKKQQTPTRKKSTSR